MKMGKDFQSDFKLGENLIRNFPIGNFDSMQSTRNVATRRVGRMIEMLDPRAKDDIRKLKGSSSWRRKCSCCDLSARIFSTNRYEL